jgi:primase-polymerase (primpol)-like protein
MTPAELAHAPIWVAWRAERRNGKRTKVPYDPRTGRRASADDPAAWATRREAENWGATHGGAGVGVVLCPIDGAFGGGR